MRLLLLPLVSACVATAPHTVEVAELEIPFAEGQQEAGFEIVLDVREGGMPDPHLYEWDELYVDVALRGNIELDVTLGTEPKPRKGGRSRGGRTFFLPDLVDDCSVDEACQRVVTVDVRRQRTQEDTLTLWSSFQLFSTQAAINVFPNTATEQEIRLRAFER